MPGDILETIDGALSDWTSSDAMRWRPEGGEERKMPGPPTWVPGVDVAPHGTLNIYPPAVTPAVAGIRIGDVMTVSGHQYRVTNQTYEGGVYTFDLEPAR